MNPEFKDNPRNDDPLQRAVEEGEKLINDTFSQSILTDLITGFILMRKESPESRLGYVRSLVDTLSEKYRDSNPIITGYIKERLEPTLMRFLGLNPDE